MEQLTDWQSDILSSFQTCWKPPFTGSIYEWSNMHVNLQHGYSITGKYDVNISPQFKKIFDTYHDPFIREVNVLAPPRSAKTLCAELCLLHTISHNAGNILWLQENDTQAAKMSDLRMVPLLKSCKPVAELIPPDRFAITEGQYSFNHCTVHVTSPKPSALNAVGYKAIFADEVWSYKRSGIITDIKHRTDDYKGSSKCMFFSQGGDINSPWHKQYISGRQYHYGWKCPSCNKLQEYMIMTKGENGKRHGLWWPDNDKTRDSNKQWVISECVKACALVCRHCDYHVTDNPQNRHTLLHTGDWLDVSVGTDFDPTVVSFRFTNFCNIKVSFADMLTRYLKAMAQSKNGDETEYEIFTQKDMADFWNPTYKRKESKIIPVEYNKDKPFGEFEKYRFLSVDVQRTEPNFYYTAWSITAKGDFRMVEYGTCDTWFALHKIRERLGIDYRFTIVDHGDGVNQAAIYAECCKAGRWAELNGEWVWACYLVAKGDGQGKGWRHSDGVWRMWKETEEVYPYLSDSEEDKGKILTRVTWSNLKIKKVLESMRDGKTNRKMEFNEVSEEFLQHMNAEVEVDDGKGGFVYRCPIGRPNHWWDCCALAVLMAGLYGCLDVSYDTKQTDSVPTP